MTELIIATAVGTVLAIAGATIAKGAWVRRRRPLEWVATGTEAVERRRQRIDTALRSELVHHLFQRATVLNIQVSVAVKDGAGYVTVTFHPGGHDMFYVADHQRYTSLLSNGELPPTRTHRATWTQPPVSEWPDEELRV